jgi:hypothetical protein
VTTPGEVVCNGPVWGLASTGRLCSHKRTTQVVGTTPRKSPGGSAGLTRGGSRTSPVSGPALGAGPAPGGAGVGLLRYAPPPGRKVVRRPWGACRSVGLRPVISVAS